MRDYGYRLFVAVAHHVFCRLPVLTVWGFIFRAYKNDGFGSQWYRLFVAVTPREPPGLIFGLLHVGFDESDLKPGLQFSGSP